MMTYNLNLSAHLSRLPPVFRARLHSRYLPARMTPP